MLDSLLSEDIQILRQEIVRLRALLDSDFKSAELLRVHNEHLKSIIESLILNGYGKQNL